MDPNSPISPSFIPHKLETTSEKIVRKFSAEPFVPVGCAITLGFLLSGFKAFSDGNSAKSQKLMRGRVVAQGVTIAVMVGYASWHSYNGTLNKPPETDLERDVRLIGKDRVNLIARKS